MSLFILGAMNQHIYIKKIFKYVQRKIDNSIELDFSYNKRIGAWVSKRGTSYLIDHNLCLMTKKADVETGEDRKGQ